MMDQAYEISGWIGATLFATCAAPQAYKTWKTKSADDLSWIFILMWFFGEIFTSFYIVYGDMKSGDRHYPLYMNYVLNTAIVVYLIYAKAKYSKKKDESKHMDSQHDDGRGVPSAGVANG